MFHGDKRVTTFSMHSKSNYPWRKELSDYDVELPDQCQDDGLLSALSHWLPILIDRHQPELVLYQAGVDALKEDALGRLAISRRGLQSRNEIVFKTVVDAELPTVVTMGGGYARPVELSVDAHVDVYVTAAEVLARRRER